MPTTRVATRSNTPNRFPYAQMQMFELLTQVMALVGDQVALVLKKGVCLFAAGSA